MQPVEQGVLHLDAPIASYLPDFRLDDQRYRQVTLRHALSHTSGLPDMDEDEYAVLVSRPEADEGAPARYVRALANRKMIAAPGQRFAYSNIAYNVLGYLIAQTSGQTFEAYLQEHILRPAGMPESTLFFPDVPRDRLAVPHLRAPRMIVNPVYPYHRADAPASFLHSTLMEMCQWAITCLAGGAFNGQRILTPASYDLMWTPVAEWGHPPLYEHICLGWTLGHYGGFKTVSHGGMGFGWTDFLTLLPEKNSAAVILCNEESSARSRTIRAALNVILGHEPVVGPVSWMVPVSLALEEGGLPAATARYAEIKNDPAYFFDADELANLVYQLLGANRLSLAVDALELNLSVFPDHLDSLLFLGKLYLQQGRPAQAKAALQKALALAPQNPTVLQCLEKMQD